MATAPGAKEPRDPDTANPTTTQGRPGSGGRQSAGAVVGLSGGLSGRQARGGAAERSAAGLGGGTGGVLVIGREIQVKGEIGSCRTLVVEGRLEAAVEVGSLQLAEDGLFDGRAEVDEADIAGRFEGELVVRGQLLLRPTAKIHGEIRYGRIVIEGGGEISGDVAVLPESERKVAVIEAEAV